MNLFARLEHDDGFTSVTFMLMLLILVVAVGALSVDLWHLVAEHREVAGVVDGATISTARSTRRRSEVTRPSFGCNQIRHWGEHAATCRRTAASASVRVPRRKSSLI